MSESHLSKVQNSEEAAARQEAEEQFRRLLDLSGEGLVRIDALDRITFVNARVGEMLGCAPADLIGRPIFDLVFPEDMAQARAARASRRHGAPVQYDLRMPRADGTECWVSARVSVVFENETYAGTLSLLTDITDRRRAEDALRRSEARLAEAQRVAKVGSWDFDLTTGLGSWSAQMFDLVGRDPKLGAPTYQENLDLYYPEDAAKLDALVTHAIEQGKDYALDLRRAAPDGSVQWYHAIGQAVVDASGETIRLTGTLLDITDRKQTEEALTDAFAREALVNTIGNAIRSVQAPEEILRTAVESLGRALNADRCYYVTYDLARQHGTLGPDWHRDDLHSIAGEYAMYDFNFNHAADYLTGGTHVVADTLALPNSGPSLRLGLRSLLRAPLAPGPVMTALAVAMADQARHWTPNEIRLVEAVASQTQAALEAARFQQKQQRIAATLQDALKPGIPEDVPGLKIASCMRPALEEATVGGDFCDIFPLDSTRYAVVIGDVSGKGLAAAAQLAAVRNMLRVCLYQQATAAAAVRHLNAIVTAHGLLEGFVTLFVGIYEAETGDVRYVSCGHEPALHHTAAGRQTTALAATSLPLGVDQDALFAEGCVTLAPGDSLLLYTDGLAEAGPNRMALLGTDGMIRLMQAHAGQPDVRVAADGIIAAALDYSDGTFRDDVCALFLRRR